MKEAQEKINQIQIIQQNMHNMSVQRQQFQVQQAEIENALSELSKTEKSYKIIGTVMVAMPKDALHEELEEKKQMTQIRIATIEKQEEKLRIKAQELQQEVLAHLEKNDTKHTDSRKL